MTVRTKNHEWLRLTVEEPLSPDLPICDPHHHLWDLRTDRIAPRYLLDEILEDVRPWPQAAVPPIGAGPRPLGTSIGHEPFRKNE